MTQLPPAAHSSCSASQRSGEVGSSAADQKRASSSISGTPSTPLSCLAAVLLPAPPRPSRTTRLSVPTPPASQVSDSVAPDFRSTALNTRVAVRAPPEGRLLTFELPLAGGGQVGPDLLRLTD